MFGRVDAKVNESVRRCQFEAQPGKNLQNKTFTTCMLGLFISNKDALNVCGGTMITGKYDESSFFVV